ncbi:MAG: RNase adapter RapZ [Syntrophorhabdaceae bacterium]|nr:RNase adapter RapZ [Syntrophorhabdaceae bacterium]
MTAASRRARRANIVIITGLSGAGKSTAANVFEDIGYYRVDNVPPVLLPKIVEVVKEARGDDVRVAIIVDVRGKEFLPDMKRVIEEWEKKKNHVLVLFFDANDEVLLRRFSETRRMHPVAASGDKKEAIRKEREILSPLCEMSDVLIDTSDLTVHQLRDVIVQRFCMDKMPSLKISVISFGFRYGLPPEADMVVDVRFIPNPHFVASLKRFSGLDSRVREYVFKGRAAQSFLRRLTSMLQFLLPLYRKEGKAYFTLAVGCTGGRHRSVAVAAALGNFLGKEDKGVIVTHRDIARSSPASKGAR